MSGVPPSSSLDSFEQTNFVAVANYLGTRLCPKPQVANAQGVDESGAENSILVTGCKRKEALYLGELLGRYAHQKWILVFDPAPKGNQRLFIVTFAAAGPADMLKEIRKFDIKAGTIVPAIHDTGKDQPVRAFLWVQDHSQESAIHAFAKAVHGAVEEIAGSGTMIGDDSRISAQRIFDREIKAYELAHRRALSKLLWSATLHDLGMPATPK